MLLHFLTFQLMLLLASPLARATEIENVIDNVEIDFRSLLLNKNQSKTYLYKPESGMLNELLNYDIKMSRLYSNQLDEKTMRDFFKLENKTQILIAKELTREKLCLSLKSCGMVSSQSDFKCVLNLNLILYMSPLAVYKQSSKHFNHIKLIKINLVVSNLSDDYLEFEKQIYEFNLNVSSKELGSVKAFSLKNSDLNGLIKYYIVSNSVTGNGFQIDETTGTLTVNYTNQVVQQSKFEFFVDAFMQCSFLRPLKNRTLVKVNLINQSQNKPNLIVTNLIETKQLTNRLECFKLTKNDFSNNVSVPLAQLQFEDSDSLNNIFDIKIRPNHLSNMLRVEVKKLIDNIYVVYLSLGHGYLEYHQTFLTDLFQLNLKLTNSNFMIEKKLHLCINVNTEENLHEELSLVQFEKSVYTLEMDKSAEINVLNFDNTNSIGFSIDNNNDNFKLDVQPGVNSSSFRLKIKSIRKSLDSVEILQYIMTGITFNDINETRNLPELYNNMNRMSVNNGKFLSFACRIVFNTERETFVNDSSAFLLHNQADFYVKKIYIKIDDLVNNSIVGYLPDIYTLINSTNNITHLSYKLTNLSSPCFRLNKYTGVLTFNEVSKNLSELNCYNKDLYPLTLDVSLNSNHRIIKHAQILIHDVSIKSNDIDASINYKKFYETNSNSVNIIYEPSHRESSQINMTFVETFNLNFKFNFEYIKPQHGLVRLVNLVSNFGYEREEYQTKFELSNKLDNLFLMDSKKAALYLNLEKLMFSDKSTKCAKLDMLVKNFIYRNSIKRHLHSMDRFNLNLCLINGENGQNIKEIKLDNLNISYNSFLTPILVNVGGEAANFDYLVENSLMKPNFFYSFLYVSLSFSILSAFLILIVAFICQKRAAKKATTLSHPSQDSQRFYHNFQSNSFSSTSTTSNISNELKIRNDLSKTSFQNSIENNQPLVPSLYQHGNVSIQKQDAYVPLCHQIKKTLNDSFNTSSTRLENEEQGVYCIATGMSFSLTSNISSVTNSQFVDDNYQMNIGSPVSSSSSSNINYVGISRFRNNDCTKLSLFDLTPNPQRFVHKAPPLKLAEKRQIIENTEKIEIDENMKKWIFINYNFNCNSDLSKEKNKPTLLDTSCANSNVIDSNCSNECII